VGGERDFVGGRWERIFLDEIPKQDLRSRRFLEVAEGSWVSSSLSRALFSFEKTPVPCLSVKKSSSTRRSTLSFADLASSLAGSPLYSLLELSLTPSAVSIVSFSLGLDLLVEKEGSSEATTDSRSFSSFSFTDPLRRFVNGWEMDTSTTRNGYDMLRHPTTACSERQRVERRRGATETRRRVTRFEGRFCSLRKRGRPW